MCQIARRQLTLTALGRSEVTPRSGSASTSAASLYHTISKPESMHSFISVSEGYLFNNKIFSHQVSTMESSRCRLGSIGSLHRDETEPTALASVGVVHDSSTSNLRRKVERNENVNLMNKDTLCQIC